MQEIDESSKHVRKASDHLSMETVPGGEHAPQKKARQQEPAAMMQHIEAALGEGRFRCVQVLQLPPAEAAVSVITLVRGADKFVSGDGCGR
jgi:hypothetical protein